MGWTAGIDDFEKIIWRIESKLAKGKRLQGHGGYGIADILERERRPYCLCVQRTWNGEVEFKLPEVGELLEEKEENDISGDPALAIGVLDRKSIDI